LKNYNPDSDLDELMRADRIEGSPERMIVMKERVLIVGAHPDDVDFAVSGTMKKWVNEGREIYYLICTDGDKGGTQNDLAPDKLVEIRRAEQMEAAAVVGVKEVIFLGRSDGELIPDKELKEDIVRVIRRIRPQKVFSFDPANLAFDGFYLYHSDHRAVAITVFDASCRRRIGAP